MHPQCLRWHFGRWAQALPQSLNPLAVLVPSEALRGSLLWLLLPLLLIVTSMIIMASSANPANVRPCPGPGSAIVADRSLAQFSLPSSICRMGGEGDAEMVPWSLSCLRIDPF